MKNIPIEVCGICGSVNAPEGFNRWYKVIVRCQTCQDMEREHPAVFAWVQSVVKNAIEEHTDYADHERCRHRDEE